MGSLAQFWTRATARVKGPGTPRPPHSRPYNDYEGTMLVGARYYVTPARATARVSTPRLPHSRPYNDYEGTMLVEVVGGWFVLCVHGQNAYVDVVAVRV
jgi:hypothetical protein